MGKNDSLPDTLSACLGADLSPLFSCIEFATVGRKRVQMADASLTRSSKKWASAHGPLNEAGDDRPQVVICATRGRCDFQTSQSRSGTAHPSPGQNPDH